ncbi:MAG: trehalose-phosphatase [Alphaproteobacteria bacterium]|nr:trehalose-phosphatase [Alphaproteobacteria bacterium]
MWLRFNPARDALFLDIDGTLLDIAPTAREVVVSHQLIKDLGCLHDKLGGALAFISGRTIEDIDGLFAPLRLPCSGVHGAEWRLSSRGPIKNIAPLSEDFRNKIIDAFAKMKGVRVEDKAFTLAVHFRQSPEFAEKIEKTLSSIIEKADKDLLLVPGRKVFEVSQSSHDKGQALERLMSVPPFKGRRPVFLGDDVTDLSAIGACLKRGGIAARVGQGNKTPQNAFADPDAVRTWIKTMMIELA